MFATDQHSVECVDPSIRNEDYQVKQIIIAGLGSAGYAALSTLKRLGCKDDITIIDPKPSDLIHPCGLPYALEGKADKEHLSQNIGLDRMGIKKISGRIAGINTGLKTICIDSDSGQITHNYDSLLLCTGSLPVLPPIPHLDRFYNNGIYTLSRVTDLTAIEASLCKARSAVVIGAGAIGLECAVALHHRGLSVTVLEMRDQILPGALDPDMAAIVTDHLSTLGIQIILSTAAKGFIDAGSYSGIQTAQGEIQSDICILAAGFSPNCETAKQSGIETERLGITVNERLQTSAASVFAAGDCSVIKSVIDGKPISAKLATSSYRQGVIAAYTILGMGKKYNGSAGTFASVIGGLEVAATGFTLSEAQLRGFDPVLAKISSRICPDYYANDDKISIKVIADKYTGRILGAQCVGMNGAAARINVISTAIEFGATLDRLESVELAYCPAISEVYDPLLRAIDGAQRRIKPR
jgi:NADPH-dependent 2,4-dienoyl-CoA reductase/sulfur reductase-like enzyme